MREREVSKLAFECVIATSWHPQSGAHKRAVRWEALSLRPWRKKEGETETDRERQRDRETERQRDRQTERQRDRERLVLESIRSSVRRYPIR